MFLFSQNAEQMLRLESNRARVETRIILEKNVERNTFDNVLRTPLRGCDHSLTNPSEGNNLSCAMFIWKWGGS